MSGNDDDVPLRYVMERVRELQDVVVGVGHKIDERFGEYAVRLARAELRLDLIDRRLDNDTSGRRYVISTVIATVAVLVSIAALIVTVSLRG
ncbi:hypothetical protein [Saccharothrix lopnurensis]|uniref:Uncharacterized protein n=1 Tax=Saccharothrix lopnurensis TaxID=1670621 RepID=A0ABW1P7C2_9PSEU